MAEPTFRQYESTDADAVWDLHEWAMRDAGTDPTDIPGTDDLRDVSGRYHDAGGEFLVGVLDGEPTETMPANAERHPPTTRDGTVVAMGGFLPNEAGHADERTLPGAAELHRMRVAPTHQRRGYGRQLLSELETAAGNAGFDCLLATTARRQRAAVEFYREEGYDVVDDSTAVTETDEYELVHFEKRF